MISNSFSGVAHNGVETIDVFGKDVLIIGTVSIYMQSIVGVLPNKSSWRQMHVSRLISLIA